ncbi:MAG: LysE family transporter [Pseudomonadota bacterium]
MPIELIIAFSLVFLFDSLAPGPAVAAVVAKGATTGAKRTAPFIVGLVIGELIFFALALAGLAALAATMGPLFAIIKWAGIGYLLFLAVRMWTAPPVKVSRTAPNGEGLKLLGVGTLLPLGNPMTIGFYLALLPTVLDVSTISMLAALEMAFIIMTVWGAVLFAYAAAADRASGLISTPNAQKWLNRTAAGAMVGAAGSIAAQRFAQS